MPKTSISNFSNTVFLEENTQMSTTSINTSNHIIFPKEATQLSTTSRTAFNDTIFLQKPIVTIIPNLLELIKGVELKWILMAGGSAIVSILVLLAVMLKICCKCFRRPRKRNLAPKWSNNTISVQSEPPKPNPNSPETTIANQHSIMKNTLPKQFTTKKLRFSGTGALYSTADTTDSTQQPADAAAYKLAVLSAPSPSPDSVPLVSFLHTFTKPASDFHASRMSSADQQLGSHDAVFSSDTDQEIETQR